MKLVIDIPEEEYSNAVNNLRLSQNYDGMVFRKLIKNGTPLPKGHGRLIDASVLFDKVGRITPTNKHQYKAIGDFMNMITYSPTVIEADEESEG